MSAIVVVLFTIVIAALSGGMPHTAEASEHGAIAGVEATLGAAGIASRGSATAVLRQAPPEGPAATNPPTSTLPSAPLSGGIRFVNAAAPPPGNGLSWATAFTRLQDALAVAAGGGIAEIWVARGVYRPHTGTDRNASFMLPPSIQLLGGFAGNEGSADERDPVANPTILSGDLLGNDIAGFGNRGDNSRHVVTALEPTGALIDGFVVERGNADFLGDLLIGGGGMFVLSTGGSPNLIRVADCTFRENSAGQTFVELGNFGGGLLVRGTDAEISNSRFEDNRANNGGGLGLFHMDAAGVDVNMVANVTDCVFARNDVPTQGGGGLWSVMGRSAVGSNQGTLNVTRCRFEDNHAGYWGAWIDQNTTFLTVENCEFRDNRSDVTSGALGHVQTGGVDTSPIAVRSCSFEGNQTDGGGGGVWLAAADAVLRFCVFRDNSAAVGGCIFSAGYFQEGGAQDLVIENCLMQGNDATEVGAIRSGFNPLFRMVNSTIANNRANGGSIGGVFSRAGLIDFDSVLLHGNRGISGSTQANQFQTADAGVVSINFTLLEGWNGTLGGTGNFSADPSFVNPLGPDGIAGTGDEDMRIATGSPCIDAGNNNALPAGLLVDLAAAPRRVDDPSTVDTGLGTPPLVDIGAYEFQGTTSGIIATPGTGTDTLVRVWPNPSSSITEIGFSLPLGGAVRVAVYDVTGRAIAQPFAGTLPAGEHRVLWDGRNDTGTVVAPGVYHVRVESPADGAAGRRRESVRIIIDR